MCPRMPHWVVTVKPSICKGGHFYCISTLAETIISLYCTWALGGLITNTNHDPSNALTMYWQTSHWLLQWSCSMSLIISLTGLKLMTVTMTQICRLILICWLFYCCNMSMHMQKVINYFISFLLILKWLMTLELLSMVPRIYTIHFSYNMLLPCSVWKKKDTTKASEELGPVKNDSGCSEVVLIA